MLITSIKKLHKIKQLQQICLKWKKMSNWNAWIKIMLLKYVFIKNVIVRHLFVPVKIVYVKIIIKIVCIQI